MGNVLKIAKALTAGAVAFGGAVATAAADGHVTAAEWFAVVCTTAGAAYAVWQVPNRA
jgi:hypothetical protein